MIVPQCMLGVAIKINCRKNVGAVQYIFATAHREFRLTNQTVQQSGFNSVNMMIEQGLEETIQ
jgi:hypothetical protein